MAADGPKEVDEKQFADLWSRCRVDIFALLCCICMFFYIFLVMYGYFVVY